ncbi:hypothetical protein D3C78_1019690 [compost metagenome]
MLGAVVYVLLILYRQSVHVCPQPDGDALFLSAQKTDNACASYVGRNLKPQASQVLRYNCRCTEFLKPDFRVLVKVTPPVDKLILQLLRQL